MRLVSSALPRPGKSDVSYILAKADFSRRVQTVGKRRAFEVVCRIMSRIQFSNVLNNFSACNDRPMTMCHRRPVDSHVRPTAVRCCCVHDGAAMGLWSVNNHNYGGGSTRQ